MTQTLDQQLLQACKAADVDSAKSLLESGANAALQSKVEGTWGAFDVTSPILYALRIQDKEKRNTLVSLLLKHKANVNCKEQHYDRRGCGHSLTALELALSCARNSDTRILSLFLQHNANPNHVSIQDIHSFRTIEIRNTLLTDAVKSMDIPVIQCLLEGGADPNLERSSKTENEYGQCSDTNETALHICANSKHENAPQVMELLLKHKADVNHIRTYLHQEKCEKPDYATRVVDPRDRNYRSGLKTIRVKETAIHTAIREGNSLLVKILMDHDIDTTIPFTSDDSEQTLHEVIANSSTDEEVLYDLNFAVGKIRSFAKSARK